MKKLLFALSLLIGGASAVNALTWKSVMGSTTGIVQPGMTNYQMNLGSGTIGTFLSTTSITAAGTLTARGTTTLSSTTVTGPLNSSNSITASSVTGTSVIASTITLNGNTLQGTLGSSTYIVPSVTSTANIIVSMGSVQTIYSSVTIQGQLIGKGTGTNDSAGAGFIGEYTSTSVTTNTNFPSTTQYGDGASLSLTPGDWELTALLDAASNSSTWTVATVGISSVTGNANTNLVTGDNRMLGNWASSALTPLEVALIVPGYRVSIAAATGTQTWYLKVNAIYSAGNPQYRCRLSARRLR